MTGLTFLVQISVGEKEGIATVWGQIGLTHWKLCQTKLISEFGSNAFITHSACWCQFLMIWTSFSPNKLGKDILDITKQYVSTLGCCYNL